MNFFYTSPFLILNAAPFDWNVRVFELMKEEFFTSDRVIEICVSLFQSILLEITRTDNKGNQVLYLASCIFFASENWFNNSLLIIKRLAIIQMN